MSIGVRCSKTETPRPFTANGCETVSESTWPTKSFAGARVRLHPILVQTELASPLPARALPVARALSGRVAARVVLVAARPVVTAEVAVAAPRRLVAANGRCVVLVATAVVSTTAVTPATLAVPTIPTVQAACLLPRRALRLATSGARALGQTSRVKRLGTIATMKAIPTAAVQEALALGTTALLRPSGLPAAVPTAIDAEELRRIQPAAGTGRPVAAVLIRRAAAKAIVPVQVAVQARAASRAVDRARVQRGA